MFEQGLQSIKEIIECLTCGCKASIAENEYGGVWLGSIFLVLWYFVLGNMLCSKII